MSYKHAWVLMLDADERANPAMVEIVRARAAAAPAGVDAFRLRRRDHFLGRWLKYATTGGGRMANARLRKSSPPAGGWLGDERQPCGLIDLSRRRIGHNLEPRADKGGYVTSHGPFVSS